MNRLRLAAFALAGLLAAPAWATLQAPTILLSPASIVGAGTSTLTITLDNDPPGNPSNIAFNFVYPANVFNSAAPNPTTNCLGGTVSAPAGGNSLSLSGASLSGNNICTVTVTLTSCNQAVYSIGGFGVTSSSGNPTAGTANLTVTTDSPALAATSTVSASPGSVPADDTTTSTVTVTTRNACGTGATNKSVSLAQGAGSSTISPGSAPTDANGVATFTVKSGFDQSVTYTATVTTDSVVITQTAVVTFTPLSAPTVIKSFSPGSISTGGSSTLTVTITNPNTAAIAGVAFDDTYPPGLVNAGTPALSNTCTSGVAAAAAGGNQLALTGGLLAGMTSCSVSVSVTSSSAGSYLNSTGPVTSNNAVDSAPASATLTVVVLVSSFNVVQPAANALTGRIFTKIAGQDIAVDIVALDASNNVATTFTGTVAVELVNSSGGGACDSLPPVKALADQNFIGTENGRHALSGGQFEANAFPNLRFRIKYPTGAPTVISCSGDAFANRPNGFASLAVTDNDWEVAGINRALNGLTFGAVTHKAGRPVSVRATAVNGAGAPAVTTNYAGSPTAVLAACGSAACTPSVGTLTLGAAFAAGQLTTDVASYDNVGAFRLQLVDSTFASVDAADGSTPAQREITSATVDVGRFVPDHFTVSLNSPEFGTACGTFTYVGQKFDYTTAPVITVTARNFAGNPTTFYDGSWWRITDTSLTPATQALRYTAAGGVTLDVGTLPNPTGDPAIAPTGNGVGTLTFASGTGIGFNRGSPVAPFDADISLALNVIDADGVAYASNPARFGDATAGNGIAFNSGKSQRFGRLRMQSAYGPGTVALPMLLDLQTWNGTAFVHNAADSCTTVAAADIALSDYKLNLGAGETSIVEATVTFTAGGGRLTLSAPGAANNGSVLLTPNLAATRSYLRGKWTGATWDEDPAARATFGLYGSQPKNFIFFRENY